MLHGLQKLYADDADRRILSALALAEFAQYHLIDIHPFKDNNGRISQLISKRLLDCCPVPVRLFPHRHAYMLAVSSGRSDVDPFWSSAPLLDADYDQMQLLLRIAVDHHYASVLDTRSRYRWSLSRKMM